MSEDEWVSVAMSDDVLVAELLLKLIQAKAPRPPQNEGATPALRLDWSVRQRRSKQVSRKKVEPTRASPTTPLSWSGATSISGAAADGFEESSVPAQQIDTARSKVAVPVGAPAVKRSRRKKTLPELKEEEVLQLKERRNLKNQLETLRKTIEKERATNESLKKMKLDLLSGQMSEIVTVSIEPSSLTASFQMSTLGGEERSFMLPDLNQRIEDDSGADVLYGTS